MHGRVQNEMAEHKTKCIVKPAGPHSTLPLVGFLSALSTPPVEVLLAGRGAMESARDSLPLGDRSRLAASLAMVGALILMMPFQHVPNLRTVCVSM
eukprot:scaffold6654_cov19-Tisochrysis_lutea.AAC.1